ncbi:MULTISPECIES: serine/threonine-protein kinase [unclassified Frankia]|uniref:serine/threonine-protein kinase n=1 Tax=unclassified Frankia TaxID=2632575 RepID=UPI002AD4B337|nr:MULTISPECIES: protein kinase [unclassified Frankia]
MTHPAPPGFGEPYPGAAAPASPSPAPVAPPPGSLPPVPPAVAPVVAHPFGGSPLGTVLDGRYLLEGRIATGGMGEVWRGLDQTLGRPVAVKLLRPEYASDESFLVRFRGEARHAARVSHPGVASVYDYGEVIVQGNHPTAYLVMELVEGEPLSALLHREKRLSPEKTLDVLGQAADALQAAHALGVVHRDVKPGNLLLRTDGAVKVTDFGIARAVDAAPLTATGIMMGTAYYVSPEQASGRPVTPASDVYSLGVVAYECLAGRRPFDDRNPIVVVMAHQQDEPLPLPPDVPEAVRGLVQAAMAKDPARRPASAGGFAHTAAAIRRSLWSADATRRGVGPGAVPHPGSDTTARRPGPAGSRGGPDFVPGQPTRERPPSWTRQPSWNTGSPEEIRSRWDARSSWNVEPHNGQPRDHGAVRGSFQEASDDGAGPAGGTPSAPWDARTHTPSSAPTGRPDIAQSDIHAWQPSPANRTALRPPGGRAARRRADGSHGGSPGEGRRKLSLPVLILLLIATVAVTALITRTIAGSNGSATSAPPPSWAVHVPRAGGGIVTNDSVTGNDRKGEHGWQA